MKMLKNAVFKPLFGIHGKRNRQPVFVFLVTGGRHGRSKEERYTGYSGIYAGVLGICEKRMDPGRLGSVLEHIS